MTSTASPTARALQTLEILQLRPQTTADGIAERLGVSARAARRYIEILREAGAPIESSRGRYGGYRIDRGTRLPPVVFTEAEALGLVMAVLESHPEAVGNDELIGSALTSVIRALPHNVGRQAAALREYAAAAPGHHVTQPDPAITSALIAAVASHRRIQLQYRSEAGNEWQELADPWAAVVRHGRWYLLCHSHHSGATRTYRIDRIRAVTPTADVFEPPEDLDPVALLEEHLGRGWEFPTRVTFDAPLCEVERWVRPPMGCLERCGDGCTLVGSTNNPAMYVSEWLASIPLRFRVDGGPELRAAMAALTSRLAASIEA